MPRCVTRRLLVLLDVVGAASRICVKHKCDASHLLFWEEYSNLLSSRQLHNPRCITISAMHHYLCDASSSLRCIIISAIYHHLYDKSSPLRYIITSAMHHHLYVPTGRCRLTSSIVPTDFDASNRRLRFKFDQCACTNCCRRFLR